jgi:hypothetical protein
MRLFFPPDNSDEWSGFNDPGVEHFTGAPYVAVGREMPQNTLDATKNPPARLVVKLLEIPTTQIPSLAEYRDAMKRCAQAAKNESVKAQIFFKQALDLLNQPKLKVLQVADFNTTGVQGPCKNGTPYYALMKASGQSKKPGDHAIGSFGIGKFAPFATSSLRTVFVSTVWSGATGWHHYVQGKSVLMSHLDSRGKTRRGVGYWGISDGCLPVSGLQGVPAWLQRSSRLKDLEKAAGTTISILGFETVKGWQDMLAASVAENFFGAINRGLLVAEVAGRRLDQTTLEQFFQDDAVRESIKDMRGEPSKFESSRLYLEVISSPKATIEQTENQHLGKCELRLLVREGMPRRVAVLRDGMLITQELDRLRRFAEYKDFVAVLECKSSKGNELLRAMEPPRHDDFEPDRLPTTEAKRKGRIALREVANWVRNMLGRHARDPISAVTNIEELKDFFADESGESLSGRDQEENPLGKIIIRARALRPPKKPTSWDVETEVDVGDNADAADTSDTGGQLEGASGGSSGSSSSGSGTTSGAGQGTGADKEADARTTDGGQQGASRMHLLNVRAIPTGPNSRRVAFTPERSGKIRVQIQDSGADTNRRLPVASSSVGNVRQGYIDDVKVEAGTRCVLDVEFDDDFSGTLRLTADAI